MEFFTSIGILAVLAIVVFFIISREDNKRNETEHLRQLAAQDGAIAFDKFCQSHSNLTYEQALREFYKDPKKLAEAEETKKRKDELHRKYEEREKKEKIVKRVYAYKYEDFIYSLFSPFAQYLSNINEWDDPFLSDVLPEEYVIHRMKEIGSEDTNQLFSEFLKNGLLRRDITTPKSIGLGFTLTSTNANVISEEDMNMDKWIKKNGQSKTKRELLADVNAYPRNLY